MIRQAGCTILRLWVNYVFGAFVVLTIICDE